MIITMFVGWFLFPTVGAILATIKEKRELAILCCFCSSCAFALLVLAILTEINK